MLRDELCGVESDWMSDARESAGGARADHREIDRQLRRIARQRCGLDAEEARWLRLADEKNIWRQLGYVSGLEYLEEVFGYAPRAAQERIRVARELASMPAIESALAGGAVPWSIARELTRVATSQTEGRWLAAASGRNLRDVERMVAGHRKGDEPDDVPDPDLVLQTVTFRLKPSTVALLREARRQLDEDHGEYLDDDAAVEAMCRRVLEGSSSGRDGSRPARMIHMTLCKSCKRATQNGAGVPFDVSEVERDVAECDAIVCDDDTDKRATQTIPPAIRRKVLQRDGHKCRFPGCRSTRNLDVHHLRWRSRGGGHQTSNLATLCGGHHHPIHDGVIEVQGNADQELTFVRDGKLIREAGCEMGLSSGEAAAPARAARTAASCGRTAAVPRHSDPVLSRYAEVEKRTLTKAALQQAGFKPTEAARAANQAAQRLAHGATLEAWIREALKHTM